METKPMMDYSDLPTTEPMRLNRWQPNCRYMTKVVVGKGHDSNHKRRLTKARRKARQKMRS